MGEYANRAAMEAVFGVIRKIRDRKKRTDVKDDGNIKKKSSSEKQGEK